MSPCHASRRRSIFPLPTGVLAAAVGVLAPMIAMGAAPPRSQAGGDSPGVTRSASAIPGATHGSPPRWRSDRPLPIAPPVTAYPSDRGFPTESPVALIGGGRATSPAGTGAAPVAAAAAPSAATETCVLDEDCDDCNPCTLDECRAPVCVHTSQDACTTCSDGVFCNGMELCNDLGQCRPALSNTCVSRPGTICDEVRGECVAFCRLDADCDDYLRCTGVEVCEWRECVGGNNAGAPCTDDTPCTGVGGFCGGVCRSTGYPCGAIAGCTEPVGCATGTCDGGTGHCVGGSNNGLPCITHECTLKGRCCTDDGTGEFLSCTRRTKPDCDVVGGRWLNAGDDPATTAVDEGYCNPVPIPWNPDPDIYFCPRYSSGIAPEGALVTTAGPIGAAPCNPLHEIGDDYVLTPSPYSDYLELTAVRFVGAFQTDGIQGAPSRVRITFYDETGGLVTETSTSPLAGVGLQIHTVMFSANTMIPARGWITLQAALPQAPFSRHFWATTDAVDTGGNDPALLWVNGGPAPASSVLGEGVPGVLAFELVGYTVPAPLGACCGGGTEVCREELPWICEGNGGYFWGIGTDCRTCENNSIRACVSDAECPACVGGAYEGKACSVNYDCPGGTCTDGTCVGGVNNGSACNPNTNCGSGGTCTGTAVCLDVPPACSTTACCDPASGVCTEVTGAACSDTGGPCLRDADCLGTGATCDAPCPSGTTSQGFGTNCDPDCCEQPLATGWDTCAEADDPGNLSVLTVPPTGSPPVTYTFSGDNSLATFGDYGTNGDGTCGHDLFDPDGETRDRGWWHAFQIDSCAVIKIDFCCSATRSGQSGGPKYWALWTGCDPCGSTAHYSFEASAYLRPPGEPLSCRDGSGGLAFYGPLAAGTYYYPIYSGVNATWGAYQLHITVAGCPTAACCLTDDTCQELDRLACDAAGGRWQGQTSCDDGDGDPGGCTLQRWDCAEGLCATGSCCVGGPGQCSDRADPAISCYPYEPSRCMDRTGCNALGGSYTPGVRCDDPRPPCPTCEFIGPGNCQLPFTPNDGYMYMSDLAASGNNGIVSADDFIPWDTTLSQVCVWGLYLDVSVPETPGPRYDCTPATSENDHFRIRVFNDAGGIPGALHGQSTVTGANIAFGAEPNSNTPRVFAWWGSTVRGYTLTLDTPITGMSPGTTYWLEVANATFVPEDTCNWHWMMFRPDAAVREAYAASGISPGATIDNILAGDSVYIRGSERAGVDLGFCLSGPNGPLNFTNPPPPSGCCWQCNHTNAITTPLECMPDSISPGVWNGADPICAEAEPLFRNDTCQRAVGSAAGGVCGNGIVEAGEQCDDGNLTPDDGCDALCQLECEPPVGPPAIGFLPIGNGLFSFDTACSTNDGPTQAQTADAGSIPFDSDIWYEYRADCTGYLVVDQCATQTAETQFGRSATDAAIAIYHDYTPCASPGVCTAGVCVGGVSDGDPCPSFTCPCPGRYYGTYPGQVSGGDDNCNGYYGSAGYVRILTFKNECWLIRVGGWEGARGRGLISVSCDPIVCMPSAAPVPATVQNAAGATVALRNNRFVSFQGGDPGRQQAVRFTFTSLPPPWDGWNGTAFFVGPPFMASEVGSKTVNDPPAPGSPGFKAARLQCAPEYRDWSLEGIVHVFHEAIVPSRLQSPGSGVVATPAVYDLQLIGDLCHTARPQDYGPPLTNTSAGWGDLGELVAGQFRAADDKVSIDDALSVLAKFASTGGATTKPRNELVGVGPSGPVAAIDGKIDISDILAVLSAFGGGNFTFAASAPTPCP